MKREIIFDFSKWGQEGISVETDTYNMVTLHKNPINNLFYGVDEDGDLNSGKATEFKMYEEVKPREFWVNVYSDKTSQFIHFSKQEASIAKSDTHNFVKTIKLVEVIE